MFPNAGFAILTRDESPETIPVEHPDGHVDRYTVHDVPRGVAVLIGELRGVTAVYDLAEDQLVPVVYMPSAAAA